MQKRRETRAIDLAITQGLKVDNYLSDPEIAKALDVLEEASEALTLARARGEYTAVCFQLGMIWACCSEVYKRNDELDQ
jgi:hypothetical protein